MKRFLVSFVFAATILSFGVVGQATTINYGGITYSSVYTGLNFSDIWDLTAGDLTLSYSIDMSGVTQTSASDIVWVEVGLREVGATNFMPGPTDTYQGGAGGWMTSSVDDLAPDSDSWDIDDKHNLQASGGQDEADYDATNPNTVDGPFGTSSSKGIWFDRDGVDSSQDDSAANTGGVYNIDITYHAINAGLGTMFATVNGNVEDLTTGFDTNGDGVIDTDPAGLSFKGNMKAMQVFSCAFYNGAVGDVIVSGITANGSPVPEPATMMLFGVGLLGIAGVSRRKRS